MVLVHDELYFTNGAETCPESQARYPVEADS